MKILHVAVRLVAGCLLVVACGCDASAGLTFHAPYGWKAEPYAFVTGGQLWSSPFRGNEWLLLVRRSRPFNLSRVAQEHSMQFGRGNVDQWDEITICGEQPALYGAGEYYQGLHNAETMRIVVSNANGTGYAAQYVYPATAAPNGEALAALRQLCKQ